MVSALAQLLHVSWPFFVSQYIKTINSEPPRRGQEREFQISNIFFFTSGTIFHNVSNFLGRVEFFPQNWRFFTVAWPSFFTKTMCFSTKCEVFSTKIWKPRVTQLRNWSNSRSVLHALALRVWPKRDRAPSTDITGRVSDRQADRHFSPFRVYIDGYRDERTYPSYILFSWQSRQRCQLCHHNLQS